MTVANPTTCVVRLDQAPAASVIGDLIRAGVELSEYQGSTWVRFPAQRSLAENENLLARLIGEPWIVSSIGSDGLVLLQRPGHQVPTASLPCDLRWTAAVEIFAFSLPTPAMGSQNLLDQRPPLQLVRGGVPRSVSALSMSLSELVGWATQAPAVRLHALRWLCRGAQALVLGEPLPPIAGTAWVNRERILLPAGWQWQPMLPPQTVLQAFCAAEQREPATSWLIWEASDAWGLVDEQEWTALTRASVRAAIQAKL